MTTTNTNTNMATSSAPSSGAAALMRDWPGSVGFVVLEIGRIMSRDLPDVVLPEEYTDALDAANRLGGELPPAASPGVLADAWLAAKESGADPATDPVVLRELAVLQLANSQVGAVLIERARQAREQALRDHRRAVIATLIEVAGAAAGTLRESRRVTELGPGVTTSGARPQVLEAWTAADVAGRRFRAAASLWRQVVDILRLAPISEATMPLVYAGLDADQLDAVNRQRARRRNRVDSDEHMFFDLVNVHADALGLVPTAEYRARLARVKEQREAEAAAVEQRRQDEYAAAHPTPPQAIPPEQREEYARRIGARGRLPRSGKRE